MNNSFYEKANRDEFVTYLDTTPTAESMDFTILGVGVTELGVDMNPNVEQEKWVIERNTRNNHESNQKSSSVTQSIYKNDPCYKFIKKGKNKLNNPTHILDIDRTEKLGEGKYFAELSEGMYTVNRFLSATADIEYTLYYQGDPKIGSVTFTEDGKPVFEEDTTTRVL